MGKKVIHKFDRKAQPAHLCGDVRNWREDAKCCSRYWKRVTCRRCLTKRKRVSEANRKRRKK